MKERVRVRESMRQTNRQRILTVQHINKLGSPVSVACDDGVAGTVSDKLKPQTLTS